MDVVKIRKGYTIKGYILTEMIGAGGFSTVYKAQSVDPSPLYQSVIAVKVLHPRRIEKGQIEQFIKEGRIAKTLEHPNIVKVFDVVRQDGNYFILMELLDTDLLKAIRTKPEIFDREKTMDVIIKTGKGISYLHKNGIIHKDINPSNILISLSLDKVKITDFGLARKHRRFFWRGFELKGGTEGYIAPEIIEGKKTDEKSDIYSFGKTIEKIFSELGFSVPSQLQYIIKISTDPNPNNRFESMENLLYILENRKI